VLGPSSSQSSSGVEVLRPGVGSRRTA
jgi:hypothetical protein